MPSIRYAPYDTNVAAEVVTSGDFVLKRAGSQVDARAAAYDRIRKAVRRIVRVIKKLA